MAYLIITNGLDQGQLFELSEGPNVLGRDGEADIQIALSAVSRQHACLHVSASTTFLPIIDQVLRAH